MPERHKQAPELVILPSATISRLPGALLPSAALGLAVDCKHGYPSRNFLEASALDDNGFDEVVH